MFVSYKTPSGFGYMCLGRDFDIDGSLIDFIKDKLFDDVELLYASGYSDHERHYVWIHTDGMYRTEDYLGTLKDVEDIGLLYTRLHKKYGFTNILGFLPNEIHEGL